MIIFWTAISVIFLYIISSQAAQIFSKRPQKNPPSLSVTQSEQSACISESCDQTIGEPKMASGGGKSESELILDKFYPKLKVDQEKEQPKKNLVKKVVAEICQRAAISKSLEAVDPAAPKKVPGYQYFFSPLAVGSSPQGTDIEHHADYDYNLVLQLPKGEYVLNQDMTEISGGPDNVRLTPDIVKQAVLNAVKLLTKSQNVKSIPNPKPTSYRRGTPVVIEIASQYGPISVDLAPVVEIRFIKKDPRITYIQEHPVGTHRWPERNKDQVLFSKLVPVLLPIAGNWGFSMAHGMKLMVENLNQHHEKEVTVEKELYRVMKGLAKLYWGKNLVKIQSFALFTIFCYEREQFNDNAHWVKAKAADRLKGMINRLIQVMETKNLDPYLQEGTPRNLVKYLEKRNPDNVRKATNRMKETVTDLKGVLMKLM